MHQPMHVYIHRYLAILLCILSIHIHNEIIINNLPKPTNLRKLTFVFVFFQVIFCIQMPGLPSYGFFENS